MSGAFSRSRLILSVGLLCLVGALTATAVTLYSSATSGSVVVDGRTWTASESDGVDFNSRPVTGLTVVVK